MNSNLLPSNLRVQPVLLHVLLLHDEAQDRGASGVGSLWIHRLLPALPHTCNVFLHSGHDDNDDDDDDDDDDDGVT